MQGDHLLTRGKSRCFPYFFFRCSAKIWGTNGPTKAVFLILIHPFFGGWIILTPPVRMISQHQVDQVVCVLRSLPFPMGSSACRLPKNLGCCCDEVCLPGAHHESPLMLIMFIGPPPCKTACTTAAVTEVRVREERGQGTGLFYRAWRCLFFASVRIRLLDALMGFWKWVCLKIGYIPNYSHLIGIMIINHWV